MLSITINLGYGWKPLTIKIPPTRYKNLNQLRERICSLSKYIFLDIEQEEISTATVDISNKKGLLTSFYLYNRKNR